MSKQSYPLLSVLLFVLLPFHYHAQSGGAAWFNAPTENYVDLGSTANSNCFSDLQNGDELSVTMWVKWDDKKASNVGNWANRLTYADSTGNGDNGTFWCQHNNKNDRFEFAVQTVNGRDYIFSTTNPQEGKWYHVAQVYDGSLMLLYVNGNLESWKSKSGNLNVSSKSKLNMGRWPNAANNHRFFDGLIDEVSVWKRALTPQEVSDIMNNPESVTGSSYDANGLIGYWDFDDYTVDDKSPCDNDGSTSSSFSTVPADGEVTRTVSSGDCSDPNIWDNGVPNDSTTAMVRDSIWLTQNTPMKNLVLEDTLMNNGDTLYIEGGDFIHDGDYISNGGVLEFNGSTTNTRKLVAKKPMKAEELVLDVPSEVRLDSGVLKLKEKLEVVSGTLDIADKQITLLSDSTGTARIAPIPNNSQIKGQVAVQRWIPSGNAGWIDMASPNKDSVTLAEWDDDIYLSGKTTGGFNDGCSWSSGCFWSVKRSDSAGQLVDVTSTATPLENGRGYELFIGDDGGVNVMNSDTTVTVKGRIKEPGSFTVNVNDNEWTLIANPFASPIDFDQVGLTNVDPYYYVAAATGSYEWYDRSSGSSSHPNVGPIISSSQGFWVKGNGSNAHISFEQSHKSSANAAFAKNGGADAMKLSFRDASNGLSSKLLFLQEKMGNSMVEVSHKETPVKGAPDLYALGKDSGKVRSKIVDDSVSSRVIPLKVVPDEQGLFNFSLEGLDALPYSKAFIEDRSDGRFHELREKGMVQVTASSSDSGASRFFLHLTDDPTAITEDGGGTSSDPRIHSRGKEVRIEGSVQGGPFKVSIHDASGRKVLSDRKISLDGKEARIQTDLSEGIYFVRLRSSQRSFSEKVFLGKLR